MQGTFITTPGDVAAYVLLTGRAEVPTPLTETLHAGTVAAHVDNVIAASLKPVSINHVPSKLSVYSASGVIDATIDAGGEHTTKAMVQQQAWPKRLQSAVEAAEKVGHAVVFIDMPLPHEIHAAISHLQHESYGEEVMLRLKACHSHLLMSRQHDTYWTEVDGTVVKDDGTLEKAVNTLLPGAHGHLSPQNVAFSLLFGHFTRNANQGPVEVHIPIDSTNVSIDASVPFVMSDNVVPHTLRTSNTANGIYFHAHPGKWQVAFLLSSVTMNEHKLPMWNGISWTKFTTSNKSQAMSLQCMIDIITSHTQRRQDVDAITYFDYVAQRIRLASFPRTFMNFMQKAATTAASRIETQYNVYAHSDTPSWRTDKQLTRTTLARQCSVYNV